jgi:ADP-ribosylglycohydrolase
MEEGDRRSCAELALTGLSVGDAFGERFFTHPDQVERLIAERELPPPPWRYTDDTEMAISIVAILRDHAEIDGEALAGAFAARYDPMRGYGAAMHGLMARLRAGEPHELAAAELFGGQGSYGNGAAMRVAPVGAFFADDLETVVEQARRSAAVTHAHPEGQAGAIAVAVAAALFARGPELEGPSFFFEVLDRVPASEVREGIQRAAELPASASVREAVSALGNGSVVTAQDTVPFCLWCLAQQPDSFEEALWLTVSGLGDRDTNCAIVGGVIAGRAGLPGIPSAWIGAREPLPAGFGQLP